MQLSHSHCTVITAFQELWWFSAQLLDVTRQMTLQPQIGIHNIWYICTMLYNTAVCVIIYRYTYISYNIYLLCLRGFRTNARTRWWWLQTLQLPCRSRSGGSIYQSVFLVYVCRLGIHRNAPKRFIARAVRHTCVSVCELKGPRTSQTRKFCPFLSILPSAPIGGCNK